MDNILLEIHNCRRCLATGYESVQPSPVFEGNPDTPLLIVGQAPGIKEFNQKQPFAGSNDKQLFSWLQQAGLRESWIREHPPIFQRYLCYPGKKPDRSGDRRPSSKQIELCQPNLSGVLSLMTSLNLRLILSIGRLAIDDSFPTSKPLEEIVGQQLKCSHALVELPPRPSVISRWHQTQEHRALIYRPVKLKALEDSLLFDLLLFMEED